jgi:hypothetical protein
MSLILCESPSPISMFHWFTLFYAPVPLVSTLPSLFSLFPVFKMIPVSSCPSIFPSCTQNGIHSLHCKKRLADSPSPGGMSLTTLPWPWKMELFPAKESLVSDMPAGYVKTPNLFLQSVFFFPSQYIFPLSSVSLAYFPLFPQMLTVFGNAGSLKMPIGKTPLAQQIYVGLRGTG